MFLKYTLEGWKLFCRDKNNLKIKEEELLGGKKKEMDAGDMIQLTESLLYTKTRLWSN